MRLPIALPLILACAFAVPAFAQPGTVQPVGVQAADSPVDKPSAAQQTTRDQDAAAALAVSLRMQEQQARRIAEGACRAGDQAKCELLKAPSDPKPPVR